MNILFLGIVFIIFSISIINEKGIYFMLSLVIIRFIVIVIFLFILSISSLSSYELK